MIRDAIKNQTFRAIADFEGIGEDAGSGQYSARRRFAKKPDGKPFNVNAVMHLDWQKNRKL